MKGQPAYRPSGIFEFNDRATGIAGYLRSISKASTLTEDRLAGCGECSDSGRSGERSGGAFEPCGLPDPPDRFCIRPNGESSVRRKAARHRTAMDFAPWHAPLVNCRNSKTSEFRQGKVLPTRKPLLLLRLSGWLVLRFAERRFVALLLNDPPRSTRVLGPRPRESDFRVLESRKLLQLSQVLGNTDRH